MTGKPPLPQIDAPRRLTRALAPMLALVALSALPVLGGGPATTAVAAGGSGPGEAALRDTGILDLNADGIEDILQHWRAGRVAFTDLRDHATAAAAVARAAAAAEPAAGPFPEASGEKAHPARVRLLSLDVSPAVTARAIVAAGKAGSCRALFSTPRFGGVTVLEVDEPGLGALLAAPPGGRLVLDRDGVPALDASRKSVGAHRVETGPWRLGNDGTFSLAILDSGCDTAHGDLGDAADDDIDGPPPSVGDAGDWYPGEVAWPQFTGYKVIGWHDVTDDYPQAAGPWDYHHHGTALASVAAGSGAVDAAHRGVAPAARLVVVKFYDFDTVWHAWAGDFLAACDWVLDRHQALRIGPVLMATNWDAELGIAGALRELADAGLLPVAAMGNFGTDGGWPGWPARLSTALTVGAVGDDGAVAAFSGRGGGVPTKPDLVAPGGGLQQTNGRVECADSEPDDTYSGRWGTSLAAAHAAGALHLLDEALGEQAAWLPRDVTSARLRLAVLRLTAAPVMSAETADGSSRTALPAGTAPRDDRGWGLLRVDAASQALLVPLRPGADQTDSLFAGSRQPVVARRLDLQPRVRYLVEALPGPGLDIELVVADPRVLDVDRTDAGVTRLDASGAGTSEYTYVTAIEGSWQLLAVKRLSGQGVVTLRVREAGVFPQQGAARVLPGAVTGMPSCGNVAGFSGPSFVVPSLVASDPVARSVNLLASDGTHRINWPVFVFPHVSAEGGLNLPLVWNLDGAAGDEIVVSSEYGSVYFFAPAGTYQTVNLALNRWLTPPVGYVTADGQKRVLVLDAVGNAYAWRAGPVQELALPLGRGGPQVPAVGVLGPGPAECIVVAFADGTVTALDDQLAALPGWPRSLGAAPAGPPVLVDLDLDGWHEVVVPMLQGSPAAVVFRVLDGDGLPGPGDGATVSGPTGGGWQGVSWPAVAGRPGTGELHVGLFGLVSNGQAGAAAAWNLGEARLGLDGVGSARAVPGLHVRGTTSQGELVRDALRLAPPLAWNHRDGWGTDLAVLVHLAWHELLYGLSSVPGQTTAWYLDTGDDDPLAVRRPVAIGGEAAGSVPAVGATMLRVSADLLLRLDAANRTASITPVADLHASDPLWATARADGRNSGAYPLVTGAAATPAPIAARAVLTVQPNPGSGRFSFSLEGEGDGQASSGFEVYDLRGRRVAEVSAEAGPGRWQAAWDGRDVDGRPLPAGTYLVRARAGGPEAAARVTIVR
ncbi:MAG: S8 family serine peptidase [bacterium]|nr:S8 family serine peptidase [bacterium]